MAKRRPKVLVMGSNQYPSLFQNEGWEVPHYTEDDADRGVDLVCLTGGCDIDPEMYNETLHINTQNPDRKRDRTEVMIFNKCIEMGVPIVGICRGAQILTVLSGGTLIQHVIGHQTYHHIVTEQGEIHVSSSHHQLMYPWKTEHLLLGYAEGLSNTYSGRDEDGEYFQHVFPESAFTDDEKVKEPEVVFYPKTRALCHQAHPEWMNAGSQYTKYFFNTIKEYLGVGV